MKKTFNYLLILCTSFIFSSLHSQELVYEQDHGVSFNKGTIDSDALIAIIQKKQEELNKFVLGRIVTKSWIDPKNDKQKLNADSSRLNNFTTKYLIYETLNELTITADKSKFGKNTLQLVKESAIIFGLAVAMNENFLGGYASFDIRRTGHPDEGVINEELLEDTIGFNQTIDMVLNVCITDPNLKGYFPLYGRLANPEDPNRFWYENDSRYLQEAVALHTQYASLKGKVDLLFGTIAKMKTIKQDMLLLKEGKIDTLLSISNRMWYSLKKGDTLSLATVGQFKTCLSEINALLPVQALNLIPQFSQIQQKIDSVINGTITVRRIQQLNEIIQLVSSVRDQYEAIKAGDFSSLIAILGQKMSGYIIKADELVKNDKNNLASRLDFILNSKIDSLFKVRLGNLLNEGVPVFDTRFMTAFNTLNADYNDWKLKQPTQAFDQVKLNAFLKALDQEGRDKNAPKKEYKKLESTLNKQLQSREGLTKNNIIAALVPMRKDSTWKKVLDSPRFSPYKGDNVSKLDTLMLTLEKFSDRISMVNTLLQAILSADSTVVSNHFTFNEQQIESTKKLMGRFIDYLDKSGRFSVAAVYLRSIVDNVSYKEADSIERKPATISLSFESVLYSLKDQLVKPSQLYRTRYFQPYINIGVNYSGFLFPNALNVAEDGTTSTLKGMTFASEKIGIKYKIINREYTRSFKPGIVYKYYGHNWSWDRPQPQGFIDDLFLDIHTGGLLYNVVNLKTEDSFNFPYVGCGIGVRTFNGLTFSGAFNVPYTGNSFRKENVFITFGIDIPIIEYITAIRSK